MSKDKKLLNETVEIFESIPEILPLFSFFSQRKILRRIVDSSDLLEGFLKAKEVREKRKLSKELQSEIKSLSFLLDCLSKREGRVIDEPNADYVLSSKGACDFLKYSEEEVKENLETGFLKSLRIEDVFDYQSQLSSFGIK